LFRSQALAVAPAPLYIHPAFDSLGFDRPLVMPVIDARVDTSTRFQYRKVVAGELKRGFRGYKADLWTGDVPVPGLDLAGYRSDDSTWIRGLPAGEHRWVMVICVEDANLVRGFGTSATIELSAAIFDVADGVTVWRARGLGRCDSGGLIGMVSGGENVGMAISEALGQIKGTIPKRSKKK
jgi:hypothetical protein